MPAPIRGILWHKGRGNPYRREGPIGRNTIVKNLENVSECKAKKFV